MKTRLMTPTRAWILAAGFGLGLGFAAMAQDAPRPMPHGGPGHPHMQAQHAKEHGLRLQDLKTKLKLTPAQEGAWTAFEASMKPISSSAEPPKMEALAKMNAIQRMEERQKMHAAHDKQHAQQLEATKTLYGKLSAEQQAIFDKETLPAHAMHSSEKHKGKGPMNHSGAPKGPMGPGATPAGPAAAPSTPGAPTAPASAATAAPKS